MRHLELVLLDAFAPWFLTQTTVSVFPNSVKLCLVSGSFISATVTVQLSKTDGFANSSDTFLLSRLHSYAVYAAHTNQETHHVYQTPIRGLFVPILSRHSIDKLQNSFVNISGGFWGEGVEVASHSAQFSCDNVISMTK